MLEYNFNELDNDFITIWCRYISTQDISYIINDLEKLAELGQVNAVQSWYCFKKPGDNEAIDNIVKGYTGANFNELWAMGNFYRHDEEQKSDYLHYLKGVNDYEEVFDDFYREIDKKPTEYALHCQEKIKEIEFVDYWLKAIDMAFDLGKRKLSLSMLERANEMKTSLITLPEIDVILQDNFVQTAKNSRRLAKSGYNLFKEERRKKPDLTASDQPVLCFSFLKAVLLYNNDKSKYKNLALTMLKELSERDYSKALSEKLNCREEEK